MTNGVKQTPTTFGHFTDSLCRTSNATIYAASHT